MVLLFYVLQCYYYPIKAFELGISDPTFVLYSEGLGLVVNKLVN